MSKQPVSLLEWAYTQIKEQIFSGKMGPGQKIVVNQVSDSLDISPTPVKEAMNRLVAEGLMVALPRRGFMVKQLSMEEIHNIMDCRIMMETFAARPAVKYFPNHPETKKKMLDVLNKLENIQSRDYMKATQLEQVYHGSIIELAENQKLTDLYNMLFGVGLSFLVYASSKHPMERHQVAQDEHKLMYEYLEKGDAEKLEVLLRTHLEKTMEYYETFLPHFCQQ